MHPSVLCVRSCTVGVCAGLFVSFMDLWARACETQSSVGDRMRTECKVNILPISLALESLNSPDKCIYGKVSTALSRRCRLDCR